MVENLEYNEVVKEGDYFFLNLSPNSQDRFGYNYTYNINTTGATATPFVDYYPQSFGGSVNEYTQIRIPILRDFVYDPGETFDVIFDTHLQAKEGSNLSQFPTRDFHNIIHITIEDTTNRPVVVSITAVDPTGVTEGKPGEEKPVHFTISLDQPLPSGSDPVKIEIIPNATNPERPDLEYKNSQIDTDWYFKSGGSVTSEGTRFFVTFDPGQTSKDVVAYTKGDAFIEPDEIFTLAIVLTNANSQNITLHSTNFIAKGTIVNDDTTSAPANASIDVDPDLSIWSDFIRADLQAALNRISDKLPGGLPNLSFSIRRGSAEESAHAGWLAAARPEMVQQMVEVPNGLGMSTVQRAWVPEALVRYQTGQDPTSRPDIEIKLSENYLQRFYSGERDMTQGGLSLDVTGILAHEILHGLGLGISRVPSPLEQLPTIWGILAKSDAGLSTFSGPRAGQVALAGAGGDSHVAGPELFDPTYNGPNDPVTDLDIKLLQDIGYTRARTNLDVKISPLKTSKSSSSFGEFALEATHVGAKVYALYDSLLGRAPDTLGLEFWADAFKDGVAPHDLAKAFLYSPEGQARAGDLDDTVFVTQLYNATLHRNPEADGLAFWVDALKQGTTRPDVGLGFALSNEHLANIQPALAAGVFVPDADAANVARLYYGILSRAPDAGGLQGNTHSVEAGATLHDVAQGFLTSDEYRLAGTVAVDTKYVAELYQDVLGRTGSAADVKAWTDAIAHGTDRVSVAAAFVNSAEFQAHYADQGNAAYIQALYTHVLERAADPAGVQGWAERLDSGAYTRADAAKEFVSSGEFSVTHIAGSDGAYVDSLYSDLLGRHADPVGLGAWTDAIAHGADRAGVADALVQSSEFQAHYASQGSASYIQALYEHVLERAGDAAGIQGWTDRLDNQGVSRLEAAHTFVTSTEFALTHIPGSNAAFVDELYVNAMGRHADPQGLGGWSDALAHGATRADVAVAIAESVEAQQHLVSQIEQGWHLV